MAVEPTPRVVASLVTPAVQQPLLTPGFPPLLSPSTSHFPCYTAPPRHATVSAVNARPGLMERFTAPQLQYPRPALPQTLSMHTALPPPRMSPLGGSAITGEAYTQRHGLPGGLGARQASTPTAPATKAAQHQVAHHHERAARGEQRTYSNARLTHEWCVLYQAPPPSKPYSSSFESEEHSNNAAGNAIWFDGDATRRMVRCSSLSVLLVQPARRSRSHRHSHLSRVITVELRESHRQQPAARVCRRRVTISTRRSRTCTT